VTQDRVSEIPEDRHLLIIGAMKCATTSLFSYLAEHPAIAPCSVKEPEFFSEHQGHVARAARYQDLWDFDPARHAYAMEASTGYTKWPEQGVAERIHAYGIRPKLVYVVRDPFARIESHYNFVLHDPAWEARGMTHESLVQNSDYAAWADAYAAVFGAENLLLLDYAELVADPTRAVNRVAAFLGIAPMAAVADTSARNVTERPRSGLERRIRRLVPGLGSGAPEALKRPVRGLLAALRPEKGRMSPAERAEIAAYLAPGMARLGSVYGFDVAQWGFAPAPLAKAV
jgi:hypothetical protein